MNKLVYFLTMIISLWGTVEIHGIVPEAYKITDLEDENMIYCFYGQRSLPFEILDNSTGEYSSAWRNVVRLVSPRSIGMAGTDIRGEMYIPEAVNYNGEEYKVIEIDEDFASYSIKGIQTLWLPYEITAIGDRAFAKDEESSVWFEELNLPFAIRYIGEDAFRDQSDLRQLNIFSPVPPVCVSSEGRELKVGDKLNEGEYGPFHGKHVECALSYPEGFGFLYSQHPAFNDFKGTPTGEPNRSPWLKKDLFLSWGYLNLKYLGNGEMMVYSMYINDDAEIVEIPSTVEAYGTTCKVVGIGLFALQPRAISVKKIVFPETLQFIGQQAFYGATVEEIELPEKCIYLCDNAFCANRNLKRVIIKATEKMVVSPYAFSDLPEDVELFVESDIDETQLPWSRFKTIHKTSAGVEAVTVETGNSVTYNLQGMPVKNLRPGEIYICNGKKFVAQ